MIRQSVFASIVLLSIYGNASAEFTSYTIDGKFEAVFPAKPQLTAEVGEGEQKFRSYNYTDLNNIVVYTATYQLGQHVYAQKDIPTALQSYVKGQMLVINGSIENYTNTVINGNMSATYAIAFQYQGVPAKKHGVVSYKDGHFYQWAVQHFPSRSNLSGDTIFRQYLSHFSVK